MKLQPYPQYKPSGVEWLGEVPAHWEVKRGRFSAHVNPHSDRLRSLTEDTEVSFLPMEAIGEGSLALEQTRALTDVGNGYTEFEDGDVIVAKITPCFENGKGTLAKDLANGVAFGTTELHVLRAFGIERRFLFYISVSKPFRDGGEGAMYGAGGQKRVPSEFCKDFPLAIPGRLEQSAIADFLDRATAKIDTLVEKKRTLIERLKEKRAALISRTVTRGLPPDAARAAGLDPHPKLKPSGVEWLGEVPAHWEVKRLKQSTLHVDEKVAGEETDRRAYIGMEHIESWTGKLHTLTEPSPVGVSNLFRSGDTLFGKLRPYLAKGCTPDFDGICSSELLVLRSVAPLDHRFLLYSLLTDGFVHLVDASTFGAKMPRASWDYIGSCRLPMPPIREQRAIADFLDRGTARIDTLTEKIEAALERLQEYRAALVTAAVTGKIDVRNVGV